MEEASASRRICRFIQRGAVTYAVLHCYSFSAQGTRTAQLSGAGGLLTDAGGRGYKVASFSGGEPILFKDLGRLL